jgi:cytochrome P450
MTSWNGHHLFFAGMTARIGGVTNTSATFPVPFAASERQSWRAIASSLGTNALAGFPANAFEELAVARSFVGRRQIILSDPAAIRHVLIENADNYRRTAATVRLLGPVVGDGMLLADGEDWRTQRRAAAPAFAPRMMAAVAGHVAFAGDRLMGELSGQAGTDIDLFARFQRLALDVVAAALFSIDITARAAELRAELQAYANGVGRPGLLDFLLPRWLPAPRTSARRRFRRRWMTLIGEILKPRRAQPIADPPRDLFDMLASTAASEAGLIEQSATIFAAGHETTAVSLFWSAYLVALLPEVQARIAAEAAPLDLGPAGAAAALPELRYTRAVIDEALRLYPPAFSIVRQAKSADAAAGVAIPARAVVLIVPWVLHRHRKLWRDPDRFDPDRFLPVGADGAEPPARFSYLPFGAGPRASIGAQYALTETVRVLARLVQAFHLEMADTLPVRPQARITLQPDRSPPFRLLRRQGML